MKITAKYIDTCLPCYLTETYSGPGRALACASLGGDLDETVTELIESLDETQFCGARLETDDLYDAIECALDGVDLRYIDENGNPLDEPPDERDGDEPMIYVLVEWDPRVVRVRVEATFEVWQDHGDENRIGHLVSNAMRSLETSDLLANSEVRCYMYSTVLMPGARLLHETPAEDLEQSCLVEIPANGDAS